MKFRMTLAIASHGRGDGTLLVLVTELMHNENQYTAQIILPKPVSVIGSNIFNQISVLDQLYQ